VHPVTRAGSGLSRATSRVRGLHSHRVIEEETLDDAGRAKAKGVWAAAARWWLSSRITPIRTRYGRSPGQGLRARIVCRRGAVVLNANPRLRKLGLSPGLLRHANASLFRGAGEALAGNQSSYRRAVLLKYGSRLPTCCRRNRASRRVAGERKVLHQGSRGEGISPELLSEYACGPGKYSWRPGCSPPSGVATGLWPDAPCYALGSPLLPVIRMKRVLGHSLAGGLPLRVVLGSAWPAWLILCAGAAGESLAIRSDSGPRQGALMRFEREHAGLFTRSDLEGVPGRE